MSMAPEDRRIFELFAERVRELEPRARIWAFGSRARGEAEWHSDFDICVVLPEITPEVREAISFHAWEIGFDSDQVITTLVFSAADFEHGPISASPLVKNILQEGIAA
ncbi:MAG: nucleotidyltransferase domain-containing protein [Gemmatimonadota bacterium]|jgi:predicted nucleotidyltransferase|nr:nucleotidyltransferase domain-containing protein [Gemmatimonadota bacterium]